jgi:hypothetical protein
MFARNVSIHLKSNPLSDYARTFKKDILSLLRKQNGFKDEITFAGPGGVEVTQSVCGITKLMPKLTTPILIRNC